MSHTRLLRGGILGCLFAFVIASAGVNAAAAEPEDQDGAKPKASQEDLDSGRQLVRAFCTRCHGLDAKGARAPDLSQKVLRHANSDASFERIIRNGIPGTGMAAVNMFQPRQMRQLIAFLQHQRNETVKPVLTGDLESGKALFAKHQCATCHWTGSSGGRRGPDLSASRGRVEYVRNAILDPTSDSDSKFQQVNILTKDGRVMQGMRLSEGTYHIQLIDDKDNLYTVDKTKLEELTRGKLSLMPSFKDVLSPEEVEDLITYVFSLRRETVVPGAGSQQNLPANQHN